MKTMSEMKAKDVKAMWQLGNYLSMVGAHLRKNRHPGEGDETHLINLAYSLQASNQKYQGVCLKIDHPLMRKTHEILYCVSDMMADAVLSSNGVDDEYVASRAYDEAYWSFHDALLELSGRILTEISFAGRSPFSKRRPTTTKGGKKKTVEDYARDLELWLRTQEDFVSVMAATKGIGATKKNVIDARRFLIKMGRLETGPRNQRMRVKKGIPKDFKTPRI